MVNLVEFQYDHSTRFIVGIQLAFRSSSIFLMELIPNVTKSIASNQSTGVIEVSQLMQALSRNFEFQLYFALHMYQTIKFLHRDNPVHLILTRLDFFPAVAQSIACTAHTKSATVSYIVT